MCEEAVLYLYHDIISKTEMSYMKKNILNLLKIATVRYKNGSIGVSDQSRTQSSGWLRDHEHEFLYKISKKVSFLTGLETVRPHINGKIDTNTIEAEDWQVGLYGSGGHQLPHLDTFSSDTLSLIGWNNSTWVGNRSRSVIILKV